MFNYVLKKIIGTKNDRELKRLRPLVARVNELEPRMKALKDEDFPRLTAEWKEQVQKKGRSLDDLLPEAFALVREAGGARSGMRHFDVQLIGGMVLHQGKIAEMKTGEGKTLVATLPCYLNALAGKGVHVVTVNDYLARRDAEWMGRIYRFLGLTTGVIVHGLHRPRAAPGRVRLRHHLRQNNEFGFDYLRDNMKFRAARTTSSASSTTRSSTRSTRSSSTRRARRSSSRARPRTSTEQVLHRSNRVIPAPDPERRATSPSTRRAGSVTLTDEGVEQGREAASASTTSTTPTTSRSLHHVEQALRAHTSTSATWTTWCKDGEVIIVDEFTGRLMPGRRWSDGLHQAVEAKEGVQDRGREPDARHDHLPELLPHVQEARRHDRHRRHRGRGVPQDLQARRRGRPDNQPMRPQGLTRTSSTRPSAEKFNAVGDGDRGAPRERAARARRHGLASRRARWSRSSSRSAGIPHNVLNAKQHEREAEIVAQAGRKGAVTISTNMAGRGTDILLGGNPEMHGEARGRPRAGRADGGRGRGGVRRRRRSGRGSSRPHAELRAQTARSTRRSSPPAASTSSAPSATSRAASTTSCAAAPAARATPARSTSTCRSRTT